jgi:hypothetical protein
VTLSTEQQTYRFADLLEKNPKYAPVKHHQPPMWDLTRVEGGMPAELRGIAQVCHIPRVNYGTKDPEADVPEGTTLVELDANGAFVAAASSATFAHCALQNTGPLDLTTGPVPGGYLLVDAHHWALGAPGSPLGQNRPRTDADGRVWVPHTVYAVLRDLTYGAKWGAREGHWPGCTVYDSWTADTCRLTEWANVVRDTRAAAKVQGDVALSERIKTGYSQAVQMWSTQPDAKGTPVDKRKKNNKAYRPDWYAALRGQHFANMWRRAYQATILGHAPLRVWDTDRMLMTEHDLLSLLRRDVQPIPLRLDETGLGLGTFKRVRRWYAGIED